MNQVQKSLKIFKIIYILKKSSRNKNNIKNKVNIICNWSIVLYLYIESKQNLTKCKIINSCAFDSLILTIFTAYIDSEVYIQYVNLNQCKT